MLHRLALTWIALASLVVVSTAPAHAEATDPPDPAPTAPVNLTPPSVLGSVRWTTTAVADPGTWDPADTVLAYQWLRDGSEIPGATDATHTVSDRADLDRELSVRVAPVDHPELAVESPRRAVQKIVVRNLRAPALRGTPRYGRTLTFNAGAWSHSGLGYRFQWFSAGRPVKGATKKSYTLRPGDVGHVVRVEVTAAKVGYTSLTKSSKPWRIKHVTDARRTVTYTVRTRGKITQSLSTFKKQAQQTFDDPRGWRANGIVFKRVSKGGDFTLVLSQAAKLPSFSSGCSTKWSCRVGRYVVINQTRWRSASPAWRKAGGSVRDYRHMVVNHETGHWLGKGHVGCSSKGSAARVMQQQSKGLGGCRFNPWPKSSERYAPRFGF